MGGCAPAAAGIWLVSRPLSALPQALFRARLGGKKSSFGVSPAEKPSLRSGWVLGVWGLVLICCRVRRGRSRCGVWDVVGGQPWTLRRKLRKRPVQGLNSVRLISGNGVNWGGVDLVYMSGLDVNGLGFLVVIPPLLAKPHDDDFEATTFRPVLGAGVVAL